MNIRWKRWVAGAAGLLAAYTVAGFWLVPLVIKNQVPKFGQTELARQATISEVSFNPYTLRLEAQDLRLAEADGAPLFAIGKLAVELQWRSLVRRAWSFAEIRITAPSASLAIAPDGKFNLAELLAALERRAREVSTDCAPQVIALPLFPPSPIERSRARRRNGVLMMQASQDRCREYERTRGQSMPGFGLLDYRGSSRLWLRVPPRALDWSRHSAALRRVSPATGLLPVPQALRAW